MSSRLAPDAAVAATTRPATTTRVFKNLPIIMPYSLVFIRTKRRDDCGHGQQERPTRSPAGAPLADAVSTDGDKAPGLLAPEVCYRAALTDPPPSPPAEPAPHQRPDDAPLRSSSR